MKGRAGPQFKHIMFLLLNNLFSFVQISHFFSASVLDGRYFKLVWISSLTCPFGWQCLHAWWLEQISKVFWWIPKCAEYIHPLSFLIQFREELKPIPEAGYTQKGRWSVTGPTCRISKLFKSTTQYAGIYFKGLTNANDSCGPVMQKSFVYITHCLIYITLIIYY